MRLSRFLLLFLTLWSLAVLAFPRIASAQASKPVKPAPAPASSGTLSPYADPRLLTGVPFGAHSHYAQTWRATLETAPAATFLDAIGTVWTSADPSRVSLLASAGIRRLRVEEPWAQMAWDGSGLMNASAFSALLKAAQASGIRTRVLLNANQGAPCPTISFSRTLAGAATAGDTSIRLTDTSGLVPGYSGICNLSAYWAAEDLVTGVQGQTVTLAKPLPRPIPAGTSLPMATLAYQPFGTPGSPSYNATVAGWQRYELTVARTARSALGTDSDGGSVKDGGFDLECWNELSFGSAFLDARNYGLPGGADMVAALPQITAGLAQGDPADFSGVGLSDGMANTLPWPASSSEPAGISALSKHPYQGRSTFPRDNYAGTTLNALYKADPWVPSYTEHFPEYLATSIQTETMTRDLAPITTDIYRTAHGRYARGEDAPCKVAITEYRYDPDEGGAADQVTKAILRFYCFYPNKGATEADWYDSEGLLGQPDALVALSRICGVMRQGLDTAAPARSVLLDSVSDTHGHAQFHGDGTKAHPDLLDRECFAFLPYQVSAGRFVVPYYVMTRDLAQDLPAEGFVLGVSGLGARATAGSCDPRTGRTTILPTFRAGAETMIRVNATDCPQLLILDDSAAAGKKSQ